MGSETERLKSCTQNEDALETEQGDCSARVKRVLSNEEEEARQESASYWMGIVLLSAVTTMLCLYCQSAFMSTMKNMPGGSSSMAMQGLRSHGNPIVGGPGFQQGPFFPARFVGTLFDYPENDIELLPIFRAAGSVSIITALAFGLFFLIADARYRRQLRTLGEMGAGLPNPTSVDAVADRYLDESKKSPVYAKVVLDVLACAGPTAVPAISEFMHEKLERFEQQRDHAEMIFVVRCARLLSAIDDSAARAVVRSLLNREDMIRSQYLDSYDNMAERIERKMWIDGCLKQIRQLSEEAQPTKRPTQSGQGTPTPAIM